MRAQVKKAVDLMLTGHSHAAAHEKLSEDSRSTTQASVQWVVEAGEHAPMARQKLHAAARDYSSSGCCDYCGVRLQGEKARGQRMRWQSQTPRGAWTQDRVVEGRAYVCPACRLKFAPSALSASLQGLLPGAVVVLVGGVVDYFMDWEGFLLVFALLVGFLAFMREFSRFEKFGSYRGYPFNEGLRLKSAQFRSSFRSIPQLFVIVFAMFVFGAGCSVRGHEEPHRSYSPVAVALVMTVLGGWWRYQARAEPPEGVPKTWCPRTEPRPPDPNDPDLAERWCAKLLTEGLTTEQARKQLIDKGVTESVADRSLKEVHPLVPFFRAKRGEIVASPHCDLCGERLPRPKRSERLCWTKSVTHAHPTFALLLGDLLSGFKLEKREESRYSHHVLCPGCDWRLTGGGAKLWFKAGALGLVLGIAGVHLAWPYAQEVAPEHLQWFTPLSLLVPMFLGAAIGLPYRYAGYPTGDGFLTPAMMNLGEGPVVWFLMGVLLMGLGPVLETCTVSSSTVTWVYIAIAVASVLGFLYSLKSGQ